MLLLLNIILCLAIDGKDYIGGSFVLTFTPGQSASGDNLKCVDIVIINDHALEYNETLDISLNSTKQYSDVVRISITQNNLLLTIIEDAQDGMFSYCSPDE